MFLEIAEHNSKYEIAEYNSMFGTFIKNQKITRYTRTLGFWMAHDDSFLKRNRANSKANDYGQ